MPETQSWIEGNIAIFTGNMATSAILAFVENTNISITHGIVNRQVADGHYYDYATGQRMDVNIGAAWAYSDALYKLDASATAIHLKIINASVAGTAGYIAYSGRIDSLFIDGQQGGVFKYRVAAHFNTWSAF